MAQIILQRNGKPRKRGDKVPSLRAAGATGITTPAAGG